MGAPLAKFLRCERGVAAIEYALLASLIAGVILIAVAAFGGSLETTFRGVEAALPQSAHSGGGPPPGKGKGEGNEGNGKGNGGSDG